MLIRNKKRSSQPETSRDSNKRSPPRTGRKQEDFLGREELKKCHAFTWCCSGAKQEVRDQSAQIGRDGVTRILRVKAWALAALTTQTQLLAFNLPTTDSNTITREGQGREGDK